MWRLFVLSTIPYVLESSLRYPEYSNVLLFLVNKMKLKYACVFVLENFVGAISLFSFYKYPPPPAQAAWNQKLTNQEMHLTTNEVPY